MVCTPRNSRSSRPLLAGATRPAHPGGPSLARHQDSALDIAVWLQTQPQVAKVLFPALPDDPGHDLWKNQFGGAPGPFTIELQACNESSFAVFIDGLEMFGLGTSSGGFESLVMPAIPHHLRSKPVLPDDGRLVRLRIGLERPRAG